MTMDTATMGEQEQLRLQLSALHLNTPPPPPPLYQNLYESGDQQVFYNDDGLLFDIGFGNVIVVDNLPIVDARMAEKLESEIRLAFSEVGVIKHDGVSVPLNPQTHASLGRCFIEFNSRQEAELAREKRDGYNFHTHTLSVSLYDDLDRFVDILDEGTIPETYPAACMSSRYTGPSPLLSPLKEEEVPEEADRVNRGREAREQKEQDFGEVMASIGMMSIRGESME
ncbi:eukaryotic translation initiation factor 3 subunit B isoform X1 [Pyrus x bretschneideri]|uniref:eukaryotic translation initiation factor 3 subunit B isoform X1 n=1 Tax=Pyrus x bretschneideri TaxID=225117 RepID=UPI000510CEF2|nr:eukaryotic translation initiation factor 3 subunit B isoform X1 [Pyrus x bretschneideri]